MEAKYIHPSSIENLLEEYPDYSRLKISSFSLNRSKAYINWKKNMQSILLYHFSKHNISDAASEYLLGLLQNSHIIYSLEGQADLLVYFWPNKEPKLLPIWDSKYLILSEDSWLKHYPFLISDPSRFSHHAFKIKYELFSKISISCNDHYSYYVASHNNHFGHFMLDNLPGLMHLNSPLTCTRRPLRPIPFEYNNGIQDALSSIFPNKATTPMHNKAAILCQQNHTNFYLYDLSLAESIPSNLFTNAFLWKSLSTKLITARSPNVKTNYSRYEKIFICRSGKYSSRIYNLDNVKRLLLELDFQCIDPLDYTFEEFSEILFFSKLIISESGSSTINAVMLASVDTRIISLNPRRMFEQPTEGMIRSGLPYLFVMSSNVEFLLGTTKEFNLVQSSDIVEYDIKALELLINEIQTKIPTKSML